MARDNDGLTEDELAAIVRSAIDDAVGYDQTELSDRRAKAIDYYNGELGDVPSAEGRSSVTSRDLSDAIGWILPSLMRVFAGTENAAVYEPQGPEDEESARQATDFVNYVFYREQNGYHVIYNSLMEALQFGNGVIKHWWDATPDYITEDYTGLSDEQYTLAVMVPGLDVLQHAKRTDVVEMPDPQTGAIMAVETVTHDIKVRRVKTAGRMKIMNIPPEEFLIERNALSLGDANFVAHRANRTRASLIADGYDRDEVMSIPTGNETQWTEEFTSRWKTVAPGTAGRRSVSDPIMEEVEVYEAYIQVDYDGDDHPEWRKVVMAGGGDGKILANDEWGEEVPFTDIQVMPRPHRWDGRSLLDELEDVQKIKTVLMRQTLDNLYLQNNPQRAVTVNGVANPDELINPTLGGVVWEKQQGAVRDLVTPFVAANSFQMLAYLDEVSERRTGVSRTSMALDPEVLQNQTASGVGAAQAAAYAKVELYARNASMGFKRLFRCLLKSFVRHQDKAKVIRLRETWVEMDPRSWNADMDVDVNVGLGSGSRDRDIQMLMAILQQQKEVMGIAGPFNPISGIDKAVNTLREMVVAAGRRAPDRYFSEISADEAKAWMQENMKPDEGPSPDEKIEMLKVQGQLKLEETKAQVQIQREQAQMDADLATDQAKLQAETAAKREQAQIDLEKDRAKLQFEMAKFEAEMQLEREKLAQTRSLELLKIGAAATKRTTTGADGEEVTEEGPSMFDGMARSMADAMGVHSAQIAQQIAAMTAQQTETILRTMHAPKRVVRDETGRAIGVETVQQ